MMLEVEIDLTGNKRLGPSFKSVSVVVVWSGPLAELRIMVAEYYGVPLAQVGFPKESGAR